MFYTNTYLSITVGGEIILKNTFDAVFVGCVYLIAYYRIIIPNPFHDYQQS